MVRMMRFFILMRMTSLFFRLSVPWIRGAFLFTLHLMATSVISLWVGVPTAISRIADEWLDRAFFAGFPTQWDRHLYYVIWTLSLLTIVAGWILLAHLTVFLVHLIF